MRSVPRTLRALGLLCLSVGFGCSGLTPAETASGLSPLAQSCTAPSGEQELERIASCVQAFDEAAARQDARSAGQALLIWARYQDDALRAPWLKLALWLNPEPWLPASSGWSAQALQAYQVERLGLGDAQGIRFEGSKPSPQLKTYLVPIKLPADRSIKALPIKLAAAIGAQVVIDEGRIFAATPTLASLTHAGSELDPTELKRAKALVTADKLLTSGDHLAAGATLLSAIEDSDESLKPCGALAMARYSLYILGPAIFINGNKSYLDEIGQRCSLSTEDGKSEQSKTAIDDPYWSAVVTMEQGTQSQLLSTLRAPNGVEAYVSSLPQGLDDAQRQWLGLLARRLQLLDASFHPDTKDQCEDKAPRSQAQLDALIQALQKAQRHDLAQRLFVSATIYNQPNEGGAFEASLQKLKALNAQPMPKWQTSAAASALFNALPKKLSTLDRVLLQPQCLQYTDYITAQASRDKGQGASRRAVERLLELTRHQHLCSASALRPLAEQTIETLMKEEQGRLNIAKLLGQLSVEAIQLILQGKTDSIFQIMAAMAPKLEQLERSLTDAPADLTLGALLGIVRQLAQQVQPPELLAQLERALGDLDRALKTPPSPKDDELLQYAPALRLLFQHMLLTTRIAFGTGDPKAEIARIEKTLEADLRVVMRLLEQDLSLAQVVSAHLKVIYSTSLLATAPTASGLSQELQKIELLPPIKATKWWPMAISSAQVGLLSAHAWIAHSLKEEDLRERALTSAAKVLDQMITKSLIDFEAQGTNWTLFKLFVPAYELGAKHLISPDDATSTMKLMMQRLPEFERAAKLIMSDIEAHTSAQTSAPNFVDLFVEVLKATLKVGMLNIYDPVKETLSPAARAALAKDLEQSITRYSPKLQVYIYTLIAFLREDDLKTSMQAITKASKLGEGTPEAYLPALLALRLHGEGWTNPKETLTLMESVLKMTQPSTTCQDPSPLISLYPQYARLQDLNANSKDGHAIREKYLKHTLAQSSGEVTLSCQINASKGYVKASFNLTFPTSTLGFPASNEQETKADNELSTFQVGLGFSSVLEDSEELKCALQLDPVTQLTRTYQVYLDQALVGLWNGGELQDTDESLLALLKLNERLLSTQAHAMQRDGAKITHAAQWADLSQLKWVIVLAQLRGYWQVARSLHEDYLALLPRTSRSAEQLKETPRLVSAIKGLSALQPLIDELYPGGDKQPSLPAMLRAWSNIDDKPAILSALNILLLNSSVASYYYGDLSYVKSFLAQNDPSQQKAFAGLKQSMALWINPALRTPQNIDAQFEAALAQADHRAELRPLLKAFAPRLSTALLIKHLDTAHATRFIATELIKRLDQLQAQDQELVMKRWIETASDFTDLESEVNARYLHVKLLATRSSWSRSAEALGALCDEIAQSFPLHHPTLLELLTLQLALRGLAQEDITQMLQAMNLWMEARTDAPPQLKTLIKSWAVQREDPAKLKDSMAAYVKKSLSI